MIPEDALPSERYAAQEFRQLLAQIVGGTPPIRTSASRTAGNMYIGPSESMFRSEVAVDTTGLGEEELVIRIGSHNIAIVGGRPRGTLYGVYEFFERYAGVRFLTADCTHLPSSATATQSPLGEFRYKPVFEFRYTYFGEIRRIPPLRDSAARQHRHRFGEIRRADAPTTHQSHVFQAGACVGIRVFAS